MKQQENSKTGPWKQLVPRLRWIIAQNMRTLRGKKSRKLVAEAVGVTERALVQIETRPQARIHLSTIDRIARGLGVSPAMFFLEPDDADAVVLGLVRMYGLPRVVQALSRAVERDQIPCDEVPRAV